MVDDLGPEERAAYEPKPDDLRAVEARQVEGSLTVGLDDDGETQVAVSDRVVAVERRLGQDRQVTPQGSCNPENPADVGSLNPSHLHDAIPSESVMSGRIVGRISIGSIGVRVVHAGVGTAP